MHGALSGLYRLQRAKREKKSFFLGRCHPQLKGTPQLDNDVAFVRAERFLQSRLEIFFGLIGQLLYGFLQQDFEPGKAVVDRTSMGDSPTNRTRFLLRLSHSRC